MAKSKLYIIHGWTYTVEPWAKTIASLEKQGLEIEMLHVPGLTASSKKVWTIEDYVKWADRNIPDGAVALGHSNGGRILLNLCSEKPEKLSHLILLDAAGVYEISSKRDVARSVSKKFSFLKKIPGLEKVWHKLTGASDYARAPENMKATLSNMLESDKDLKIEKVSVPTSILWGEDDKVTPPHQAEEIHRKIEHSTLEVFPEWTHAPYISHPLDLAKAIFRAYKNPPKVQDPAQVTQAANISASMTLRRARGPIVPDTAERSATLALKNKAKGPRATDTAKGSAALALSSKKKEPKTPEVKVEDLAEVEYEKVEIQDELLARPQGIISTASVPKKKRGRKRKNEAGVVNANRGKKAKKIKRAEKGSSLKARAK